MSVLRVNIARIVKKRREDAKIYVEAMLDQEKIRKDANTVFDRTNRISLRSLEDEGKGVIGGTGGTGGAGGTGGEKSKDGPLSDEPSSPTLAAAPTTRSPTGPIKTSTRPTPHSVVLDGKLFGQLLEIWEYLNTFAKPLCIRRLPSIEAFVSAAKACDPAYMAVRSYTQCLDSSIENITMQRSKDYPPLSHKAANDILNLVGMQVCMFILIPLYRVTRNHMFIL